MTQEETTSAPAPGPEDGRRRELLVKTFSGSAAALLGSCLGTLAQATPQSAASAGAQARRLRKEASPQFRNGKFHNTLEERTDLWKALRKWIAGGAHREPETPLPVVARARGDFDVPPASGLRITWLGHSSVLVELGGLRFLTDPVFGERASPSRFVGPRRFFAPPLPLSEMPELDAILLSHNHFDHLCRETVETLAARGTRFLVPLGVTDTLVDIGVPEGQVEEFDWWESTRLANGVECVFVPARHFSGRSLFDRNTTLWGAWVLVSPLHRVFFSGDGGMFPGFKDIGEKYGPFDVTLMELGAYDAAWSDVHMGPEQAAAAHKDLQGRLFMPIHWATFNLALHGWTEPGERLLVEARRLGLSLALPKPGESFEPREVLGARERGEQAVAWWPPLPWMSADVAPVVSSGLGP